LLNANTHDDGSIILEPVRQANHNEAEADSVLSALIYTVTATLQGQNWYLSQTIGGLKNI